MNRGNWIRNLVFLLVACASLSVSLFRGSNPVWVAAWVAPVFLMRFVRKTRWTAAVLLGLLAVQLAVVVGLIPLFSMVGTATVKVDAGFMLVWQTKSGMLLLAPIVLIPFLVDKSLHKRLPSWASALVYPTALATMDLACSLIFGTLNTFGETQFALQPLVMTSSLFGLAGVSFLIGWSASMVNDLWDQSWNIKNLRGHGVVYLAVTGALLLYGGLMIAFPARPGASVRVAGITTNVVFQEQMGESDLYLTEIAQLGPTEYAEIVRSPRSRIDEMRGKTTEAIVAGAEIIVWQEVSLLLEPPAADALLEEMRELADRADVYLLISYERLRGPNEGRNRPMRNTSVLFTPEGERKWEYAKAFPAAGFEDVFTEAGSRDIPYLDTPYGRIGQVICADMVHPHYLRQAALKEIDLLLVPSWDTEAFTPLFTYSSAFRAVENGFTMVRVTGDGRSAVIDPYYREWAGQDSSAHGTVNFYANVPVVSRTTFYGRFGHLLPYLAVAALIGLVVLAFLNRSRIHTDHLDDDKEPGNTTFR
jgi:apolipoprotein N-acyltransferase